MASIGQHLQIKDFQSLANVAGEVLNVYYYEIVSIGTPQSLFVVQDELRDWFYTEFTMPIRDMQSNQVLHTRCEINVVENYETDFVVLFPETAAAGLAAGPYMSAAVASSFQLVRQFRTTRHGSKRIAGLPEAYADNNVLSPSFQGLADDLADHLAAEQVVQLGVGNTMTLIPVIAKTPTPPATLPTVFNNVVDCVFRGLGTQNSRKQLLS